MADPVLGAEILALRTRDAKHFATDQPGVHVARIQPGQHYLDAASTWQETANLVQPVTGGWQAQTADVTFGIVNGQLATTYRGHSLLMKPTSVVMFDRTAPTTRYRKLADASYANVTRGTDGTVTVASIFPGVDLQVRITPTEMTKQFVIASKPTLPDPVSLGWDPANTYLAFLWSVTVPSGAQVKVASTGAAFSAGTAVNDDLLVIDPTTNTTVVTFAKGSTRSATGYGERVWYVNAGAVAPFAEAITYNVTQKAVYPLTVDPTTSIAISATANDGDIDQYGPTVSTTNTLISVGTNGKGDVWRGYLRFDLSSLSGATCSSASLYVQSGSAVTSSIPVYKTTSDWYPLSSSGWSIGIGAAIGTLAWKLGWISTVLTTATVQGAFGGWLPLELRNDTASYVQFYDYSNSPASAAYLSITYTSGSTQYTSTQSGGLSFAGSRKSGVVRSLTAGTSFAGSRATQTGRSLAAGASFTGGLSASHLLSAALSAGLSFAGSQARMAGKALGGGLGFAGGASRAAARSLAATLSFAGATARASGRTLTGGLGFAGSQTRMAGRALAAALPSGGTLARAGGKALAGALSVAGSQTRSTARPLTGGLSFAGSVTRRAARVFAASLGAAGSLVTSAVHAYAQALTGGLSFAGTQSRRAGRVLTGGLSFAGAQGRAAAHAMSAGLSFAGAHVRATARALVGGLSFAGVTATVRTRIASIVAGLSFAGSQTRRTGRVLTAALPFAGAMGQTFLHGMRLIARPIIGFTSAVVARLGASDGAPTGSGSDAGPAGEGHGGVPRGIASVVSPSEWGEGQT